MNEPEQSAETVSYSDEIDLRELFRVLWAGKWLIVGLASAITIIAVVVSLLLPNVYRAEALLAPGRDDQRGGLSALAAQYGGLASLAGIELAGNSATNTAMGIEVLQSRKFISNFIKQRNILVELMATNGWNRRNNTLIIDSDIYDESSDSWVRDVGRTKSAVPSMQEAFKEFSELLTISEDSKTGFIKIAVEHYSPHVAKQWVDWLVEDINSTIMANDVREAEHAIEYLNEQIRSTSIAGLQSVFFRLIEEQTKTIMLANVSSEYIFETIDPAVAPEEKAKPRRALIAVLALILGGILGAFVVLIRSSRASSRTN